MRGAPTLARYQRLGAIVWFNVSGGTLPLRPSWTSNIGIVVIGARGRRGRHPARLPMGTGTSASSAAMTTRV